MAAIATITSHVRAATRENLQALDVEIVDPLVDPRWESEIGTHPDSGPFHSKEWARVLVSTYGHRPVYLRFSRGGKPVALLPLMEVSSWLTGRRGVSLPFSDACRPLIFGDCRPCEIFEELEKLRASRRWRHVELRGDGVAPKTATPSVSYFGHTLDLRPGAEAVFGSFDASVRRAVRKARRHGVIVKIDRSPAGIREYYRLHELTRKRHGLPPQSPAFFENLHASMIDSGLGFVALAKLESRVFAGAVYLRFGKNAVYKFGASEDASRKLRANNLVMWEAIRALANDGAESLDFGRTTLTNEGLRRFKKSWGTSEKTISYIRSDGSWQIERDASTGFHNAIFSRLPLPINRLLGRFLYGHLD
jgi:CelD/BcsL family acetyltransferase involved in cellulose biosynthesis